MLTTTRVSRQHCVVCEDGYVKVVHDKRGTICAAILRNGKLEDITFIHESDRRSNMIRMPAMTALQNWLVMQGGASC